MHIYLTVVFAMRSPFCYVHFPLLCPTKKNDNSHENLRKQKAWGSNDWQFRLFPKISRCFLLWVFFCQRHKNLTTVLFLSSHTPHTFLKAVSKTCYVFLWHLSLFDIYGRFLRKKITWSVLLISLYWICGVEWFRSRMGY